MKLDLTLLSLLLPLSPNAMKHDSALFLISFFTPPAARFEVTPTSLSVRTADLPREIAEALAPFHESNAENPLFQTLRRFSTLDLMNHYRNRRHPRHEIPWTLEHFKRLYPFSNSPQNFRKRIVRLSAVKGRTRVLYRRLEPATPQLSIAETRDTMDGDETAAVLETEIILQREDGTRNHDFFVYGPNGRLANYSSFQRPGNAQHRIQAASPYTCMTCHYDATDRTFGREPKSYNP